MVLAAFFCLGVLQGILAVPLNGDIGFGLGGNLYRPFDISNYTPRPTFSSVFGYPPCNRGITTEPVSSLLTVPSTSIIIGSSDNNLYDWNLNQIDAARITSRSAANTVAAVPQLVSTSNFGFKTPSVQSIYTTPSVVYPFVEDNLNANYVADAAIVNAAKSAAKIAAVNAANEAAVRSAAKVAAVNAANEAAVRSAAKVAAVNAANEAAVRSAAKVAAVNAANEATVRSAAKVVAVNAANEAAVRSTAKVAAINAASNAVTRSAANIATLNAATNIAVLPPVSTTNFAVTSPFVESFYNDPSIHHSSVNRDLNAITIANGAAISAANELASRRAAQIAAINAGTSNIRSSTPIVSTTNFGLANPLIRSIYHAPSIIYSSLGSDLSTNKLERTISINAANNDAVRIAGTTAAINNANEIAARSAANIAVNNAHIAAVDAANQAAVRSAAKVAAINAAKDVAARSAANVAAINAANNAAAFSNANVIAANDAIRRTSDIAGISIATTSPIISTTNLAQISPFVHDHYVPSVIYQPIGGDFNDIIAASSRTINSANAAAVNAANTANMVTAKDVARIAAVNAAKEAEARSAAKVAAISAANNAAINAANNAAITAANNAAIHAANKAAINAANNVAIHAANNAAIYAANNAAIITANKAAINAANNAAINAANNAAIHTANNAAINAANSAAIHAATVDTAKIIAANDAATRHTANLAPINTANVDALNTAATRHVSTNDYTLISPFIQGLYAVPSAIYRSVGSDLNGSGTTTFSAVNNANAVRSAAKIAAIDSANEAAVRNAAILNAITDASLRSAANIAATSQIVPTNYHTLTNTVVPELYSTDSRLYPSVSDLSAASIAANTAAFNNVVPTGYATSDPTESVPVVPTVSSTRSLYGFNTDLPSINFATDQEIQPVVTKVVRPIRSVVPHFARSISYGSSIPTPIVQTTKLTSYPASFTYTPLAQSSVRQFVTPFERSVRPKFWYF